MFSPSHLVTSLTRHLSISLRICGYICKIWRWVIVRVGVWDLDVGG